MCSWKVNVGKDVQFHTVPPATAISQLFESSFFSLSLHSFLYILHQGSVSNATAILQWLAFKLFIDCSSPFVTLQMQCMLAFFSGLPCEINMRLVSIQSAGVEVCGDAIFIGFYFVH